MCRELRAEAITSPTEQPDQQEANSCKRDVLPDSEISENRVRRIYGKRKARSLADAYAEDIEGALATDERAEISGRIPRRQDVESTRQTGSVQRSRQSPDESANGEWESEAGLSEAKGTRRQPPATGGRRACERWAVEQSV